MELELLEDSRPIARFRSLSLNIRNHTALAKSVRADLEAYNTPVVIGRHIDSSMFPYESGLARAGFERDEPTDIELSVDPAADTKDALEHLRRWGFCVLPETLPTALIEGFKRDLDQAINTGVLKYNRGTSDRIHGAHQRLSSAREVWLYKPVLQFLETYFQDIPCACQTLTYVNGSEQGAHQDTIHLTPYPAGYMCGVWIALQDVQEGSGELFVYPGSHRERRLRASELGLRKVENDDYSHYATFDQAVRDLVDAGGYERLIYRPKAGQILVWHENLIHGGSQRAHPERERLSVVSHYFPRGSVGYYDSRGEAATLETLPS